FQRLEDCRVCVHLPVRGQNLELERREKDFGLVRQQTLESALTNADAAVVVWKGAGARANESLLRNVLDKMSPGSACFVHGVLSKSRDGADQLIEAASV